MANGVAVALSHELSPPTELEQRIGNAIADATIAICGGIGDWQADGKLSPTTRTMAGDVFVELYWLQEATLGQFDFTVVARREGRRALLQRHGAALAQHCRPPETAIAPVLDEIIDWPLGILARITADERTLALAWVH